MGDEAEYLSSIDNFHADRDHEEREKMQNSSNVSRVKVIRILVYEGERSWVEECLNKSIVPLEGAKFMGSNYIKSTLIDKFPEVL